MNPADPIPTANATVAALSPTGAARALIEGQLNMLSRLAEIGMEIAEACGRDARCAPDEPPSGRDPGLVFARVARAVRMTIALQSRLMKDLAALGRADQIAATARKDRRRMRLRALVGQAVSAGVSPDDDRDEAAIDDEIEQLADEAFERLIDAEDGDLMGRPFDEVVAGIAKDLGLSPEWTARLGAAVEPPAESDPTIFPRALLRGGSTGEAGVGSAESRPWGLGASPPTGEPQSPQPCGPGEDQKRPPSSRPDTPPPRGAEGPRALKGRGKARARAR